jgi:hypothetical protein
MKRTLFKFRFLSVAFVAVVAGAWPVGAQAAGLGAAGGFAVLAGTAASCTTSTITGKVGVNFNPPTTAGCNAQFAHAAYNAFQGVLTGTKPACTTTVGSTFPAASTDLGPGTYCTGAALTFTDQTLNLTGSGPWNFEIGAGFTATNLKMVMANSGNPCNVFWWIGADATLTVNKPVSAPFEGTILGAGAITVTGSAADRTALTLTGHVFATTAVTMTNVTIVGCTAGGTVPGQGCKESSDNNNNEDGNSQQSNDASDHKSVTSAKHSEQSDKNCDSNDSKKHGGGRKDD